MAQHLMLESLNDKPVRERFPCFNERPRLFIRSQAESALIEVTFRASFDNGVVDERDSILLFPVKLRWLRNEQSESAIDDHKLIGYPATVNESRDFIQRQGEL